MSPRDTAGPAAPLASEPLLAGRYAPGPVLWDDRAAQITVLSATDTWLGDSVAVAVLDPTADGNATAAFTARARAWSRFYQPGIMELRDLVTWKGAPLAVWDAPAGGTLAGLMSTGVVGAGRVERLTGDLASALDVLAAHGIVHAHLHPGAVGLDEDGHGRLLPWPAAPAPSGYGGESAWRAPEVVAGAVPDHLSDRWSLGAVGLSALVGTGPGPLDGGQTRGLAGSLRRRTSVPLISVLTTYMASNPEDRRLAPGAGRPTPALSRLAPAGLAAALRAPWRPVATRLAHALSGGDRASRGAGPAPDLLGRRRSWGWSGVAGVAVVGAVLSVVPHAIAESSANGACPPSCAPRPVELAPSPSAGPVAAPVPVQLANAAGSPPSDPGRGQAAAGSLGVEPGVAARVELAPAPHRPSSPPAVSMPGRRLPSAAPSPAGGGTHGHDAGADGQIRHPGGGPSVASGSASAGASHLSDDQG